MSPGRWRESLIGLKASMLQEILACFIWEKIARTTELCLSIATDPTLHERAWWPNLSCREPQSGHLRGPSNRGIPMLYFRSSLKGAASTMMDRDLRSEMEPVVGAFASAAVQDDSLSHVRI